MTLDQEKKDFLKMFIETFPKGKVASILVRNIPDKERSHAAEFIAGNLRSNLHSIKGNPEVCHNELIGYFHKDEEGKNTTWEDGIIPKAIMDANYRKNAVLEIIDMHNITPGCQLHLNPLLSRDPCIQIAPKAFKKICLNDNARLFLVAENTGHPQSGIQEAVEDKMLFRLDMD